MSSPEEHRNWDFPRAVLLGPGHHFNVPLKSGSHLLGVPAASGAQEILFLLGDGLRSSHLDLDIIRCLPVYGSLLFSLLDSGYVQLPVSEVQVDCGSWLILASEGERHG